MTAAVPRIPGRMRRRRTWLTALLFLAPALGLYLVFGKQPFIRAVKYVWSTTLPIGLSLESPFSSSTRIIVLESGDAFLGKWVSEKRDVLADYHRLFGGNGDAPVAKGIAILTDSDNTASRASGDYGDIDILK